MSLDRQRQRQRACELGVGERGAEYNTYASFSALLGSAAELNGCWSR